MSAPDMRDFIDPTGQTPLEIGVEGEDYSISRLGDTDMVSIHHKFYVSPIYAPDQNPYVNRAVREKERMAAEAWKKGDFHHWVFLHERGFRTEALLKALVSPAYEGWNDPEFARLVADVWIDTENIPQMKEHWRTIWAFVCGAQVMSEDDHRSFETLPETLNLYRGECNDGGWSWTLDSEVARKFANRPVNESTGRVMFLANVPKSRIMWYSDRRGEAEVFLYPAPDEEKRSRACASSSRGPGLLCSTCASKRG